MTPDTPATGLPTASLPKLKPHNNVNPVAAGAWEDAQPTLLSALAEAIEVSNGSHDVHSVPDPWARAILFDRALYDAGHSLHRQVLGEWRGLLGLLGLRERMGFLRVVATEVNLNSRNDPRLFTNILARMLPVPRDVLRQGESFARFYLLRAMGANGQVRPFGFTSPLTLVATGAWYPDALPEAEVPWYKRDARSGKVLLTDPTQILSTSERVALKAWVSAVRAGLIGLGPMESVRAGKMLVLLQQFAEELAPGVEVGLPETVFDTRRGLGMDYTAATVLDKAHKPEMSKLSDLLIKTDQRGAPRYVIIDPDAAGKLGLEGKATVIYRDITLATANVRLPDAARLNQGILNSSAGQQDAVLHWCTPSFFFESHVIYERNLSTSSVGGKLSDPFPGCRPITMEGAVDQRRILMPLREDVLKLFTPGYLQEKFSVEWKSNGNVVCRLRLEVESIEQPEGTKTERILKTRSLVLVREYAQEDTVPVADLPYLGVWPNFQLADEPDGTNRWKRYYVMESWRGIKNTRDFMVKPPATLATGDSLVEQKGDTFKIHSMNTFPKYLICQMSPQETAGGYQGTPTGMLLLREPEVSSPGGIRPAALGIDFGTTGTSVYWSWINEPKPEQMKFEDRFFRVTASDQYELSRVTRDVFLPAEDWSTGKILSVYQVFHQPSQREILDGHVLFGKADDPASFIVGDGGGVRSNLKWGDAEQNEAAMGFLSQLGMQSLAELVVSGANEVSVRYSYPTAFSIEEKGRFIGIWARVLERLRAVTDVPFRDEGDQVENREAVAATRFFASPAISRGFLISRGALTIDIGGGTTDIALWSPDPNTQKPALMAHLSVQFAGRNLFLAPIARRPSVLVDLDPNVKIRSLTDRVPGTDSYNAQLDALIAAGGDLMLKELPARQEKVKDFLAIMSAGLCGLGFYAGLLAGGLAKAGKYKPGEQIPVFVGGNGSRLLKWCATNYFQPGMPIYDKFAACVLQACQLGAPGLQAKVQISLSPKPKEEVAFGLVAHGLGNEQGGGGLLQINEDYTNPLAGEDLAFRSGAALAWNESPAANDLRQSGLKVDPGLAVFRTFLKAARLTVDEETLSYIRDFVDARLVTVTERAQGLKGEDADQRALDPLRKEPVFIMALKKLIEIEIDEWVARA